MHMDLKDKHFQRGWIKVRVEEARAACAKAQRHDKAEASTLMARGEWNGER